MTSVNFIQALLPDGSLPEESKAHVDAQVDARVAQQVPPLVEAQVSEAVTPHIATVQSLRDQTQALRDDVQEISGLTGEDDAVAHLIGAEDSLTRGALAQTFKRVAAPTAALLDIPTYDGLPSVGHPDVLRVPGGWNGYEYWMAMTPFPTASRENPSILVSHDGVNWEAPPGLTNPVFSLQDAIDAGYGFWADTELFLSHDGATMHMIWKGQNNATGKRDYVYSTSTNGIDWAPLAVTVPDIGDGVSPAVITEEDGTFTMVECRWSMCRRTSADGVNWSAPIAGTNPALPAGHHIWHVDAVKIGGTYHALVCATTDPDPYRLFYWTSTDALTWTGSSDPAVPLTGTWLDTAGHYRSAFQPAASGKEDLFDVWINTRSGTKNETPWMVVLLRDYDLDGGTWPSAGLPSEASFRPQESIFYPLSYVTAVVGTAKGTFPAATGGIPAVGLRKSPTGDCIALTCPAPPPDWPYFGIDLLVGHEVAEGGNIGIDRRYLGLRPGEEPEYHGGGAFVGAYGEDRPLPIGPAGTLQWVPATGQPQAHWSSRMKPTVQGALISLSVTRKAVWAEDTLEGTLWVVGFRLRRATGPA